MNPTITGILYASAKLFLCIFSFGFYMGFMRYRYETEWLLMSVLSGLLFALPATVIYALWEFSWAILGRAQTKQHSATQNPAAASVTISEELKTGSRFNSWLFIIPVLIIAPFAQGLGKDFMNWIYPATIDGDPVSRLIETPFGKYSWTGPRPPTQAEIDELTAIVTGDAYWNGDGIPQDQAKALRFYLKASGSPHAQNNLGAAYYDGIGVQKNYATAVDWFRKAAEQGYASAQYNLGRAYWLGKGVPKDYAQAYMWVNMSAAQDEQPAIELRDYLASSMTTQQLAEGQRLTRERLAQNPNLLNSSR